MKAVRILMLGVLLAGVMTSGGCFLALLGGAVAGTAYVMGDLDAVLDGSPERVVDAAREVVDDMGLTLVSSNVNGLDGNVVAINADGKKVEIDVKGLSASSSKVTIRKGFFGDNAAQQQMMDRIKEKLKN